MSQGDVEEQKCESLLNNMNFWGNVRVLKNVHNQFDRELLNGVKTM